MTTWNTNMDEAPRDGTPFIAAVRLQSSLTGEVFWSEPHIVAFDADLPGCVSDDFFQAYEFDNYSAWMPVELPPLPDIPPPDGTETDG